MKRAPTLPTVAAPRGGSGCVLAKRRTATILAARRAQAGITLIIALVMLVVIGFSSVAVMRNTLSTDQVSLGARSQGQALQYAQAALRLCEARAVARADVPPTLDAAAPARWTAFSAWRGGDAYVLTRTDLAGGGANGVVPSHPPQCLVERADTPDGPRLVITARGLSLDFADDAAGRARNGASVWVQAIEAPDGSRRAWRQLVTPPSP